MDEVQGSAELEQDVYRLLTKLFLMVDDYDRRFFVEHKLSLRQFWALQYLDEEHGRSMVELSRLLLTDKSNVTAIVDHLEEEKWATRTANPSDRRVNLVVLTPEGRRVRDQVNTQHEGHIRELLSVEGTERLRAMFDLLRPLSTRLEAYLAGEDGVSASRVAANGQNEHNGANEGIDTGNAVIGAE